MTPRLPGAAIEVLRDLQKIWPDRPWTLIGATALGLQVDMTWRGTDDLDLSVSASLDEFASGPSSQEGWRRDPKFEHRWYAHGVKVDVLPAGPELLERGEVVWPSTGFAMNITGFRHLFVSAIPIRVADDLEVDVAPVPLIVLLKVIAYLDRPFDRERDLEDIAHIFESWVDATTDVGAQLLDEAGAAGVTFDGLSAFAVGRELGQLLDAEERALVDDFIARTRDESDPHGTGDLLAKEVPASLGDAAEVVAEWFTAFESGLSAGLRRISGVG